MGHNYAKPLTSEQKIARTLKRIPADWVISIERRPDGSSSTADWRATVHAAGALGVWSEVSSDMAEALDAAWRLNRGEP